MLTPAGYEIEALRTTLNVLDVRQRHNVEASLNACNESQAGAVTFRFASPGLPDKVANVGIPAICGAFGDVNGTVLYEGLTPGEYPLSLFVSGTGRYASSRLSIGPPLFTEILRRGLPSIYSLGSGETEIPDLEAEIQIEERCRAIRVVVVIVAARQSASLTYDIRLATDAVADRVLENAQTGDTNNPVATEFEVLYEYLPVGEHTISVLINQHGSGPGLYLTSSYIDVSGR